MSAGGPGRRGERRIADQRRVVMTGFEALAGEIAQSVYTKCPASRPTPAPCRPRRDGGQRKRIMFGTAWAATGEAGEHAGEHAGGVFSDPGLLGRGRLRPLLRPRRPPVVAHPGDGTRQARRPPIAKSLSDAEALRGDALKAKTEAESTLARATAEAEGIIGQAREEAERMRTRAMQASRRPSRCASSRRSTASARPRPRPQGRAQQCRRRGVAATRALLRDQVGGGKTQALVDEAIAELPRRLH